MNEPTDQPTATPSDAPEGGAADGATSWWRTGGGIPAIAAVVAVVLIAVVAFAVTRGDDSWNGATNTTEARAGGSGANGGSGVGSASGPSGTTGEDGKANGGKNGGKGGSSTTTTTTPPPTVETTPNIDVDLSKIQVAITPGSCTWNADTLDLVAKGSIRNNNPVDAVVSVDVTFLDAGNGEVDTASDLAILNPGEQASWDVLGASIDPPTGGLHCEVALS